MLNLCLDRVEQSRIGREKGRKGNESLNAKGCMPSEAEPDVDRDEDGNVEDGEHLSHVSSPPRVTSQPQRKESASKLRDTVDGDDTEGTQNDNQGDKQTSNLDGAQDNGSPVVADNCSPNEKEEHAQPASIQSEPPFSKPLVLSRGPVDTGAAKLRADSKKKLHGLLVDDNKINLRLLVTLMAKIGVSYEQAENGQEALDKYKSSSEAERRFEFICMDIGMPLMNGLESTRAIRAHEQDYGLPPAYIIACTAWGETQTQDEARDSGMDAFLAKPLKFALLNGMLANLPRR